MCAAIILIAYIPFIIVINKDILNRRAHAVKYDHTVRSGGLWPLPGQQITSSNSHPFDLMTLIISRVCIWTCIIS